MNTKPIPLIPREHIRPDADITGLVDEDGYILSSVHSPAFSAIVKSNEVMGKHLSELYRPVPNEIIRLLKKSFDGESHWAAITLPTVTPVGVLNRRFVVAFMPWSEVGGNRVALVRMRLIDDDLREAIDDNHPLIEKLNERIDHLFPEHASLDDVYLDALIDVTMRQTGFDIALHLDETGIIVDIFDIGNTGASEHHPLGSNYLDAMDALDPNFRTRWQAMLDHGENFNGYDEVVKPNGDKVLVVCRARVTQMTTALGHRVVQVYLKRV